MEDKLVKASGPVIVEEGRVLLNKSGEDNFWKFCGGRVQENESLEETAKRRVGEEMGIEIKITSPEPFKLEIKKPGTTDTMAILYHFLAEKEGKVQPGPDVKEWDWFYLDELPEDLAPNIKPALKYFKFI